MNEVITGCRSFEVYSPNERDALMDEFHCMNLTACRHEFNEWGITKFDGFGPLGNGQTGRIVVKLRKSTNYGQ